MYEKKIPYNFTIRFYDPSLFYIFRAVLKMCFWQPWRRISALYGSSFFSLFSHS